METGCLIFLYSSFSRPLQEKRYKIISFIFLKKKSVSSTGFIKKEIKEFYRSNHYYYWSSKKFIWYFFDFRDPDYDNINNIYSRLPSKAPSPSPRAQKTVHLTCECHKQGQTTPGRGKRRPKGGTDSSGEDSDGEEEGNRLVNLSINQSNIQMGEEEWMKHVWLWVAINQSINCIN